MYVEKYERKMNRNQENYKKLFNCKKSNYKSNYKSNWTWDPQRHAISNILQQIPVR